MDYKEFLKETAPLKRTKLANARTILDILYEGLEDKSGEFNSIMTYAYSSVDDVVEDFGMDRESAEGLVEAAASLAEEQELLIRGFAKKLANFYKKVDREMGFAP